MTQPLAVATSAETEDNPYLLGVFAPVHEEIEAGDLTVIGEVPRDLNGVYLRNGPNPRYDPPGRYHWFDGDGMVHAVHFEDGAVRYRNRWIRTQAFEAESDAGRALWSGVMEHPGGNPFGNSHGLNVKDSANTDLIVHRGQVLATWYMCGSPYAIDPLSLRTLGAQDFLGTLAGDMMAHPKVDERTGELFWFDYGPRPPYMRYGSIGADGRLQHVTDIALPGPRLPHDMAITDRYAVLMDLPLLADPVAAKAGRHRIYFDPTLLSRFGILPRRGQGSEIRWFEAAPCYLYHVVNAYEDGDEVVMDVCRVTKIHDAGPGARPLAKLLAYLRLSAQLYRYRFDLRTGAVTEGPLDGLNTEFPSVDSRLVGQRQRYAYNVTVAEHETVRFDGLVRYDLTSGASERWTFGPGRWGSEAPFAPVSSTEGDGYLVTFVQDERDGQSEVDVFRADDLAAGPVCRVLLPVRVPLGFHATWVRADQLRPA